MSAASDIADFDNRVSPFVAIASLAVFSASLPHCAVICTVFQRSSLPFFAEAFLDGESVCLSLPAWDLLLYWAPCEKLASWNSRKCSAS